MVKWFSFIFIHRNKTTPYSRLNANAGGKSSLSSTKPDVEEMAKRVNASLSIFFEMLFFIKNVIASM